MSTIYQQPAVEAVYVYPYPLNWVELSWGENPEALKLCPGGERAERADWPCDFGRPHRTLTLTLDAARELHRQLGEELADYPAEKPPL